MLSTQSMKLRTQLKQIQKEETRLAKKKKELEAALEKAKKQEAKLDGLVKKSGYDSPRDLVEALVDKYNIRLTSNLAGNSNVPKRKRVTVTAELRDKVKATVKGGLSMNKTSKEYNISYAVVSKMISGGYDKLK